ncbi:MAG: hypothetical protein N2050_09355, partial [Flavobacteriales bacterium]|nr:hypothetical protein [Flavobacteriales bacterium]
ATSGTAVNPPISWMRENVWSTGSNVGIGISSPSARLTVAGDGTGQAFIGGGFCGGNYTGISLNGSIGSCGVYNILSSPSDQNLFLNRPSGNAMIFRENNTTQMTLASGGNLGIGATVPAVRLAVNGNGVNVYATDAWIENNLHVQGNENLTIGGRGRLRIGTAWNYVGIYAEQNSAGSNNDLVLGASSGLVRVGPNGGGQNLRVSGLENTANRFVYADNNGLLRNDIPTYRLASSLHASLDDITGWTNIRTTCADDAVGTVNWGFNFRINGVDYTSGWISTNGILGFGSGSSISFANTSLPTNISADPMCFFHWDDHSSDLQRFIVFGTAPHRVCFIHSRISENLTCGTGASRVDVYIQLHETTNILSIRYVNTGSNLDIQGQSATFGFQYAGGLSAYAIPVGFNARVLDDNFSGQFWSIDFGRTPP